MIAWLENVCDFKTASEKKYASDCVAGLSAKAQKFLNL